MWHRSPELQLEEFPEPDIQFLIPGLELEESPDFNVQHLTPELEGNMMLELDKCPGANIWHTTTATATATATDPFTIHYMSHRTYYMI